MKITVLKSFIDKVDNKTEYPIGQVLDITDADRVKDLVGRGLAKAEDEPKPEKKTVRKTASK